MNVVTVIHVELIARVMDVVREIVTLRNYFLVFVTRKIVSLIVV